MTISFDELQAMTNEELKAKFEQLARNYEQVDDHIHFQHTDRSHLYSQRDLDDLDSQMQRIRSVWNERGYTPAD